MTEEQEGTVPNPELGNTEQVEHTEVENAPVDTRYEDLNAKFDLVLDSMSELRNSVHARHTGAVQPSVEESEEDDDEPITGAKVKKIIKGAIGNAMSHSQNQNTRTMWDNKAQSEFPLKDPKFERELRGVWSDLVNSGLDPNNPKALYTAASIASQKFLKPSQKKSASKGSIETSEAPSNSTSQTKSHGNKIPMVEESHPQVQFYMMRGHKTANQIINMRQKVAKQLANKAIRG